MTDDPETYSEEETKRRAEAALKRMLATPHKPHEKLKGGRARTRSTPPLSRKKKHTS